MQKKITLQISKRHVEKIFKLKYTFKLKILQTLIGILTICPGLSGSTRWPFALIL